MIPSEFRSDLTLTQVKNVLNNLSQYQYQQESDIYISPTSLYLSPSSEAASTMEKLKQVANGSKEEWSTNLSDLNKLVRKIAVFLKEAPKEQVDKIEEEELQNAVTGLACILDTKVKSQPDLLAKEEDLQSNLANQFIEKAILDLVRICNRLHEERQNTLTPPQPNQSQGYLASALSYLPKPQVPPYLNPQKYLGGTLSHYSSYLHFPSKQTTAQAETSSSITSKTPLILPETRSHLQQYIRSFPSQIFQKLKEFFKTEETNPEIFKNDIRDYVTAPDLTNSDTIEIQGRHFKIPVGFQKDLPRSRLLINDEGIFSNIRDGNTSDKLNVAYLRLIDLLGETGLKNVGAILNQGALAKLLIKLTLENIPDDYKFNEDSPFKALSISHASPASFEIKALPDDLIEIKYKIMFGINDTSELVDNNPSIRGFLAVERQIVIPKNELNQSLTDKSPDEIFPHMQAREIVYEVSATPEEAEAKMHPEQQTGWINWNKLSSWGYWTKKS
jgi:hypothetical protein